MQFTSEQHHDDGVLERAFTLGETHGVLWMPSAAPTPAPLLLLGHPGGLAALYPRVGARARRYAADHGFAGVTIELPGSGERPRLPALEAARADLRAAIGAGEPVDDIVEALVVPLVEASVPEWQATIDAVTELSEVGGPVGVEGGVIAIGIRLAVVEPRIAAATLFAGSYVPRSMFEDVRRVTIPLQVLLQWDDRFNDRQLALEVFDAFGSAEKTLHANTGGHTGVPAHELDSAAQFFGRHLRRSGGTAGQP